MQKTELIEPSKKTMKTTTSRISQAIDQLKLSLDDQDAAAQPNVESPGEKFSRLNAEIAALEEKKAKLLAEIAELEKQKAAAIKPVVKTTAKPAAKPTRKPALNLQNDASPVEAMEKLKAAFDGF